MLPIKVFKEKQFIYTEGESANEMYIIKSGKVRLVKSIKHNPIVIAELGENSFFGEVALFWDSKHSATAIADSSLELAVIKKESFDQQIELLPSWFQTIVRSMANRLHNALERMDSQKGIPQADETQPSEPQTKEEQTAEPQIQEEQSAEMQEEKETQSSETETKEEQPPEPQEGKEQSDS